MRFQLSGYKYEDDEKYIDIDFDFRGKSELIDVLEPDEDTPIIISEKFSKYQFELLKDILEKISKGEELTNEDYLMTNSKVLKPLIDYFVFNEDLDYKLLYYKEKIYEIFLRYSHGGISEEEISKGFFRTRKEAESTINWLILNEKFGESRRYCGYFENLYTYYDKQKNEIIIGFKTDSGKLNRKVIIQNFDDVVILESGNGLCKIRIDKDNHVKFISDRDVVEFIIKESYIDKDIYADHWTKTKYRFIGFEEEEG